MEMNNSGIGKYSLTNYKVLNNFGTLASMVECRLDTGRTHQIRVHFSNKKHSLIGDQTYCNFFKEIKSINEESAKYINSFERQALHSKSIKFTHPRTNKEMYFEVELTEDMQKLIYSLEEVVC